jgi:hypothetical protein
MKTSDDEVNIGLSRDEAIVLYDWLSRLNSSGVSTFEDQAEKRVLADIEAILERTLTEPLAANYKELVAQARGRVRDPDE